MQRNEREKVVFLVLTERNKTAQNGSRLVRNTSGINMAQRSPVEESTHIHFLFRIVETECMDVGILEHSFSDFTSARQMHFP